MKNLLYIVFLAAVLTGCEVIREQDRLLPVDLSADSTGSRHVLIEFTGFRCVNCPTAAVEADNLHHTYGDRLIVVAMHPASNPFTQGADQYDYTCPAADVYYQALGGTATTPFPTGNIDFYPQTDGYLSDFRQWATLVSRRMSEPSGLQLQAQVEYTDRDIQVHTTLQAKAAMDISLLTWLVEDSIQGAQALPDGSINKEYYHRHMLRTTGEPVWGEPLSVTFQPLTHTAHLTAPEACDLRRCHVVVIALDDRKRIINAIQL